MPEKPNSAKRKAKAPPRKTVTAAKKKNSKPALDAFYLRVTELSVDIDSRKPENAQRVDEFASFAAARQAALDAIVAAIEAAEARLQVVKRARGISDLRG